ncbi:hypothetical protein [Micromonospora sp. NPDC049301]|uniref:hypothetical protein n=1 Tax=Micromonospora sp. NPDC049301 TaxID=3155723 RepID=UPI00341D72F8
MSSTYTVRTKLDSYTYGNEPDELYWTLDSLNVSDSRVAVIESADRDPVIQVSVNPDGSFSVHYEGAGGEELSSSNADILALHQALLTGMRDKNRWLSVLRHLQDTFGSFGIEDGSPVDYASTGLTISTGLLDVSKRNQRLRRPPVLPLTLKWGLLAVTTGDAWGGLPIESTLSLTVLAQGAGVKQGIALMAPRGQIRNGADVGSPELILWAGDGRTFTIGCQSPHGVLQVCNVYEEAGPGWSRVERWTENAGLWVEWVSETERLYHCNHASTAPPTFDDLVFSVRVVDDSAAQA